MGVEASGEAGWAEGWEAQVVARAVVWVGMGWAARGWAGEAVEEVEGAADWEARGAEASVVAATEDGD